LNYILHPFSRALAYARRNVYSLVIPSFSSVFVFFVSASQFLPERTAFASVRLSIVWTSETFDGASNILKDLSGQPLSAGQVGNGDGDLIELGYFSSSSLQSPFLGEWIPLTQSTHIGDSSSGYGFDDGMFTFKTTFTQNSSSVTTYWGEPKAFTENLAFEVTTSVPPINTPLCIRFYDQPTKGGARFNTVTGPQWMWPGFPGPNSIPANSYFKIAPGGTPVGSSWKYGSTFEDPDHNFTASLTDPISISLSKDPLSSGEGSFLDINRTDYQWGDIIDLNATPDEHSYFVQWHGEGIHNPYNPNTTLQVADDQEIYAQFESYPYFLDLSPQGYGSTSGSGIYSFDDNVTISASPLPGYRFTHWKWESNGSTYSDNFTFNHSVSDDLELIAVFVPQAFTVSLEKTGDGFISVVDENGSAANEFLYDQEYFLALYPNEHFQFSGWSGDVAALNDAYPHTSLYNSLLIKENVSLTAHFSESSYWLNIFASAGHSSLSPSSGYFGALQVIEISTIGADGYTFLQWQDPYNILTNPYAKITDANISKLAYAQDGSVTAIFEPTRYSAGIDINVTAQQGGRIEKDDIDEYQHFQTYDFHAIPHAGYLFESWEKSNNLSNFIYNQSIADNQLLVEGPVAIEAIFSKKTFSLHTIDSAGGSVSRSAEYFTIDDNNSLFISANNHPGWEFNNWIGDVDFLSSPHSDSTYISWDTNENIKDLELEANFTLIEYDLNCSVLGGGTFDLWLGDESPYYDMSNVSYKVTALEEVAIVASPSTGWTFSYWDGIPQNNEFDFNEDYLLDGNSSLISFLPLSDINLTANFELIQ